MDIIASMLAYLLCMTGVIGGLVLSFMVFFSTPNQLPSQQTDASAGAIAMVVRPSSVAPANQFAIKEFPVKTVAKADQASDARNRPAVANAAAEQAAVASGAQQKALLSPKRLRRLAEKERARHLAFRERSSFEARFLHYDD